MNKDLDFIIQGRIAIDFNPTDYYNTLDKSNNFQKYIGGSSANVAIGLARLNNKVGFIGKVSDDQFGKYVLDIFKNEKIDLTHIYKHPSYKLGLTFTEMLSKKESSILMYRDQVADLEINSSEVNEDYIKRTKIFCFSGTALAKNPSRNAIYKSILLSKLHKIEVVFDLDYRAYTWKNDEEVSLNYFLAAKESDIIIGSILEFKYLSRFAFKANKFNDLTSNQMAKFWLQTANIVIIKDGKKGSVLYTKNRKLKVDIVAVKLLKGFGGGDAYASYFLTYYLKNKNDLKNALKYATVAASYMVQSHSSFDLPTSKIIDKFIEKNHVSDLVKEIK